ncbi:MAG: glycosyltransferase [Candidatus Levyibacteriota bacterium]
MNNTTSLSLIIPTLNESGNILPLVKRINNALKENHTLYEIIFIDDKSTDGTQAIIHSLTRLYPIKLFTKQLRPGKAQSLIEGLERAKYDFLCYIDADLQYPPEVIPNMIDKILQGADIVVANRIDQQTSFLRQLTSKTFMYVFGRLLHGLNCDVQSGLKVFRKEVFEAIEIQPSPWTFDLEFLVKARSLGYTIASVPIIFKTRTIGETKIHLIEATYEIGYNAIKLKIILLKLSLQNIVKRGWFFDLDS